VRVLLAILVLVTAASGKTLASTQPANLFDAVFGAGASPQINKVVVVRINPWIDRVLAPTPDSFEMGRSKGDSQALFTDRVGIAGITEALRHTFIRTEGCYGTSFTAHQFPVSWAVFYHDDEIGVVRKGTDLVVGSVYLSLNGLCASTRGHMYDVGLDGIELYLKRVFSFMNF
jgi:hypothetical protein